MNGTKKTLLLGLLAAAALLPSPPARAGEGEGVKPAGVPAAAPAAAPGPATEGEKDPPPAEEPAEEFEPGPALRAGDSLEISVFNHPELSRTSMVQTDGTVALPFLGKVQAAGRTVDTIAKDITASLRRDYKLRDPRVSVAIASFGERTVYILGRVSSAGAHPLTLSRPLTLIQLISLAGGYQEDADRSRIRIQRTDEKGRRRVLTVDLSGVDREGDMSSDIPLEDGDTVFVPRTEEVSVLGQVGTPGAFIIKAGQSLTLLRAIARAGGFTRLAKPSSVVWVRKTREGLQTRTVDMDAILEGQAEDPEVRPGDVLFVPERAF